MDTALTLRMHFDQGKELGQAEVMDLLQSSDLVSRLTLGLEAKPLYAIWRIIALSEIPYAQRLEYTCRLHAYIDKYLATQSGFTLTGKDTDLLPCYNAMLLEALTRLGYANTEAVQNAVGWIKKYQPLERNLPTGWTGKGVQKYGGCLKSTPCFIGIAKTVKALLYYRQAIHHQDQEITEMINQGTAYLLKHELFKRLSNGEPINQHILDIAFPASYQLNVVELLEIVYLAEQIRDPRCGSALAYINSQKLKNDYWKVNYVYQADGYISFDGRGKKGDWITYLLGKYTSAAL